MPRIRPLRPRAPSLLLLGVAALSCAGAAASRAEPKPAHRLAVLPVVAGAGVTPMTAHAVSDALTSAVQDAASRRGFVVVPLSKVASAREEAERCRDAPCRAGVLARLGATHGIGGEVRASSGGYRLTVWLEERGAAENRRAASKDGPMPIVVAFARAGVDLVLEEARPEDAHKRDLLAKKAAAHQSAGRLVDAARLLEQAADLDPLAPEAARLSLRRARLLEKAGDREEAARAWSLVVDRYGPRSAFALAGMGGDALAGELRSAVDEHLSTQAVNAHAMATSTTPPDRAALREALGAYERWLSLHEPHEKRQEMAFLAGEAAFALDDHDAAYRWYEVARALEGDKRADAALNALYALERVVVRASEAGDLPAIRLDALPQAPVGDALPPLLAEYLRAVDAFVAAAPKHARAQAFLIRAGEIAQAFGDVDGARRRFSAAASLDERTGAGRIAKARAEALKGSSSQSPPPSRDDRRASARAAIERGGAALQAGRAISGRALLLAGADDLVKLVDEGGRAAADAPALLLEASRAYAAAQDERGSALEARVLADHPTSEAAATLRARDAR